MAYQDCEMTCSVWPMGMFAASMTACSVSTVTVDLTRLVAEVAEDCLNLAAVVGASVPLPAARGDPVRLREVLVN